jgi:hypothetical protein
VAIVGTATVVEAAIQESPMKITNEFVVQVPIDRAWQVLTDLEGIAPCMPGAQLTGVEGEVYKGKVKVKVGPVISEFAGTAQFTERTTPRTGRSSTPRAATPAQPATRRPWSAPPSPPKAPPPRRSRSTPT